MSDKIALAAGFVQVGAENFMHAAIRFGENDAINAINVLLQSDTRTATCRRPSVRLSGNFYALKGALVVLLEFKQPARRQVLPLPESLHHAVDPAARVLQDRVYCQSGG